MKRIFFLLLILAVCVPLFGQDAPAKKLVFQEIIDKDGTIPNGVKSMIGDRLVTAVMDITDYVVLQDRAAFDGNIARGGTAAVADDIFVVEVAKMDDNHIMIDAKILNVESAKCKASSLIVTSTEMDDVVRNCQSLASKLLCRQSD